MIKRPKEPEYTPFTFVEARSFLHRLKAYQGKIPPQQLKTLRGQALSGDLEGAEKGFETIVRKLQEA